VPVLRHARRLLVLKQLDLETASADEGRLHTRPSKSYRRSKPRLSTYQVTLASTLSKTMPM
jgi:hypothetical protein